MNSIKKPRQILHRLLVTALILVFILLFGFPKNFSDNQTQLSKSSPQTSTNVMAESQPVEQVAQPETEKHSEAESLPDQTTTTSKEFSDEHNHDESAAALPQNSKDDWMGISSSSKASYNQGGYPALKLTDFKLLSINSLNELPEAGKAVDGSIDYEISV